MRTKWGLDMRSNNYRGKRAEVAIDDFMIANQDLLMLNEEQIEEILAPISKKDEFCTTNKKEE